MGAELADAAPELTAGYRAALPGARAGVLGRLWRGLACDPLDCVLRREHGADGTLRLVLADGGRLVGPAVDPFAGGAEVPGIRHEDASGRARVHTRAGELVRALGLPGGPGFAAELDHSTASLALSRAGGARAAELRPEPTDGSGAWERRLTDGHPYHPNCRSRPGFTVAEQLAYAPEHRPTVTLRLVGLDERRALVSGVWPREWREGRELLLPVHPWQAEHVLTRARSRGEVDAAPLLALRTLAPVADPPGGGPDTAAHVKTALSARLTSSVRDISAYSVETALTVSEFVTDLARRFDGLLHVTRTLGAACDRGADLSAVLRESPDGYADRAAGERVVPVAALPLAAPTGDPGWAAAFAELVLRVGVGMLDLGVALEGHGQNLLVVLGPDGAPRRLVYRDLADIRISPARLAEHGIAPPALTGRLLNDEPGALRRKALGSLLVGSLGATLGSRRALAEALGTAADRLPRTPALTAALTEPLPTKALTLMRLSPTPGDHWTTVANPAAPGRH
ncbi:IucA/IucC family protein [Streptomyces sp. BI20]|uniref:IucA/IucC family protein n=1 Tax=Streptomyces sp. BI20 TaxID=3403460 RepID=UPI003C764BE7